MCQHCGKARCQTQFASEKIDDKNTCKECFFKATMGFKAEKGVKKGDPYAILQYAKAIRQEGICKKCGGDNTNRLFCNNCVHQYGLNFLVSELGSD
jgi:hypothetical protein